MPTPTYDPPTDGEIAAGLGGRASHMRRLRDSLLAFIQQVGGAPAMPLPNAYVAGGDVFTFDNTTGSGAVRFLVEGFAGGAGGSWGGSDYFGNDAGYNGSAGGYAKVLVTIPAGQVLTCTAASTGAKQSADGAAPPAGGDSTIGLSGGASVTIHGGPVAGVGGSPAAAPTVSGTAFLVFAHAETNTTEAYRPGRGGVGSPGSQTGHTDGAAGAFVVTRVG